MQKWIIKFDDLKTVDRLEKMGVLSYKPSLYERLGLVFIQTDMSEKEMSNDSSL